jgi:hypothetical protein
MGKLQHADYNSSKLGKTTATRMTTGNKNQSRHNGDKPISFCATLSKCQQGRRRLNIACNVTKVKHITAGKLRKQFEAAALWI